MFPTYQAIEQPLIDELRHRGGRVRPSHRDAQGRNVYEALADRFGLSAEARDAEILEEDGRPRSKWENMVRWAARRLKKLGRMEAPEWGVWQVAS